MQEALLAAHRGFSQFCGETSGEWLAWLRTVFLHQMGMVRRRYLGTQKRQLQRECRLDASRNGRSGSHPLPDPSSGQTPSRVVMARERELAVAHALTQLSPDYQEVIVLRNLQRRSFDAIATLMGRSRPAVQMLWLRAIRKLQEVLPDDV